MGVNTMPRERSIHSGWDGSKVVEEAVDTSHSEGKGWLCCEGWAGRLAAVYGQALAGILCVGRIVSVEGRARGDKWTLL